MPRRGMWKGRRPLTLAVRGRRFPGESIWCSYSYLLLVLGTRAPDLDAEYEYEYEHQIGRNAPPRDVEGAAPPHPRGEGATISRRVHLVLVLVPPTRTRDPSSGSGRRVRVRVRAPDRSECPAAGCGRGG